ncbi:MAG TPA: RNA polymerase sigma factor RpoE [Janthinobacterium sp.]|nr:RNA polymerase sigma factor RpoE [Janthinobacterium sp.]
MTAKKETDMLLVTRFQQGDKFAFDILVVKYQHKLMRLISRLIPNQAQAEDVVQETFIRAFRSLHQFRGDAAFYTWLYRIGINTAKNSLITCARREPLMEDADFSDEEGGFGKADLRDLNTPESVLISKQIAAAINKALDSLPLELRTAIVLREVEGLSYDDIAILMKCPVGTVRSRLFRARDFIAEHLKPIIDAQQDSRW